ncbi:synaptic vesicle 2-related protein-like, partial [Limulus polyphemus]|uniref:Synaptic vesicle 2-related protein-like n=1 Tax=Limulus polyphemus TaxID=6850 RepID=A0ABM1C2B4_LIMPO
MVLYMEFLPTKRRGQATISLGIFWGVGSLLVVLISMTVMETTNSWRIVLLVAVIPVAIFLVLSKGYPESARHMLVSGKVKEAEKVLSNMAATNKKSLPAGKLVPSPVGLEKGSVINLIKDQKQLFIILSYAWISLTFTYYGITLLSPEVILHGGLSFNASQPEETEMQNTTVNTSLSHNYLPCKPFTILDYLNLLWITAAELPGIVLSWFLVERFFRRRLMLLFFLVYAASVSLLLVDNLPTAISLILLFVGRTSVMGCFQIYVLYTLE